MRKVVMSILDKMDDERDEKILAESIDDYSTEWDEYVSEWK